MKVRWTRAATRDLRAVEAYIAEDSPYFAREFTTRLLDSTRKLAEHPRIGRVVPEIGSQDIRELIVLRYRVGITDDDWYAALRDAAPDEVNFWQPGARAPRRMEPGWPFLFKLHSPRNFIVGGGFFVRFTVLPCFLAWGAFREKNGTASLRELVARTSRYRHAAQAPGTPIGCTVLTEPFFFAEEDWIPVPANWSRNLQTGLTYDTDNDVGRQLWDDVLTRLADAQRHGAVALSDEHPRYGADYLAHARLGQGAFRTLVTDAYHRRCAVTGEKSLPALEAAHIRSHSEHGPNRLDNGLLLRADVHRLFDDGYVTIDPDLCFVVSPRLREEFENGRAYYALHGVHLTNLPENTASRPAREFIEWHNATVYLG